LGIQKEGENKITKEFIRLKKAHNMENEEFGRVESQS
jgi:hypothetical protein